MCQRVRTFVLGIRQRDLRGRNVTCVATSLPRQLLGDPESFLGHLLRAARQLALCRCLTDVRHRFTKSQVELGTARLPSGLELLQSERDGGVGHDDFAAEELGVRGVGEEQEERGPAQRRSKVHERRARAMGMRIPKKVRAAPR